MARLFCIVLLIALVGYSQGVSRKTQATPPHCTQVTKGTDYYNNFRLDYPVSYLIPGQREAHQKLFCVNPPAVAKAVAVVCDWAAPPMVSITLGDEYVSIKRQDPSGRFLGNAVITTYQFCSHRNFTLSNSDDVTITKLNP